MLSPHRSIASLKSYLPILSFIGIATLTTHPAVANPTITPEGSMNVARGVVTRSVDGFNTAITTEIVSRNVISDAVFAGDVLFTESGAQGFADLRITSRPNPTATGNNDLRPGAIPQLNELDILTKQGLAQYVSILRAAAGADGLEDSPSGIDLGRFDNLK